MENNNGIHQIFGKEVVNDYFTANIKSEVIIDTMLTSVIEVILTTVLQSRETQNFKGDIRLLAKEFPILKEREEEREYRSWNVDYLMCDDESIYLVELKTTQGSIANEQMNRYIRQLPEKKKFSKKEGYDFICLLNHVSKTKKPDAEFEKEDYRNKCGTNWLDQLKELFNVIIKHSKTEIKCGKYSDMAKDYLKGNKADSSKKYLFTAGQILDRTEKMNDCKWWERTERKILYLTPKEVKVKKEDIINVSFEEIIKEKENIKNRIEDPTLKEYWNWVAGILEFLW